MTPKQRLDNRPTLKTLLYPKIICEHNRGYFRGDKEVGVECDGCEIDRLRKLVRKLYRQNTELLREASSRLFQNAYGSGFE